MDSNLFNNDLVEKYGLSRESISDAVCITISKTLGRAMRTKVFAQEDDKGGIEIFAVKQDLQAEDPVIRVRPDTIKTKLKRHLQYNIERELYSRKVSTEFDRYCDLQSQLIMGHVTNKAKDGTLAVTLERDLLFGSVTLAATCPLRGQPLHERDNYKVGQNYLFYVSKIRPIEVRGLSQLDIRLNRTSPKLVEGLIRRSMDEKSLGLPSEENIFKCVNRVCGAFSMIKSEKKIDKDIIKSVSRELRENIFVKFGKSQNA